MNSQKTTARFSQIPALYALLGLMFAATGFLGRTEAADRKTPVVLVPPFENLSSAKAYTSYEVATSSNPNSPKRTFQVDRYTEAPRAVLEDILGAIPGVKIVERQRVDAILLESEFGRLSGLVDAEKAVKLGKLLGANAVVMGTVLDVSSRSKEFSGYGIATRNTVVTGSVRIRVVDIESGHVSFSRISKGSATFLTSNFGGVNNSDVAYAVIEGALENLRSDDDFKARMSGVQDKQLAAADSRTPQLIEVEFMPKPDNCDVEIDGKYVGGSPLKRKLATGKEYKVRISKAGHTPWEGSVVPEAGLRISKELEPVAIKP